MSETRTPENDSLLIEVLRIYCATHEPLSPEAEDLATAMRMDEPESPDYVRGMATALGLILAAATAAHSEVDGPAEVLRVLDTTLVIEGRRLLALMDGS